MAYVRIWLPVTILVAGIALIVVRGGDETSIDGAAALWGAGLSVALLNWLYRVGASGERERAKEDEARAYFDRHGHWPDDLPPGQGT
jgi:drug/metabolite transporter (DMT)-like permease